MKHVHREGLLATWRTMRKVRIADTVNHAQELTKSRIMRRVQYGRWYPAVVMLYSDYVSLLLNNSESVSSIVGSNGSSQ